MLSKEHKNYKNNPDFEVGNNIIMTKDSTVLVYRKGFVMTITEKDDVGVKGVFQPSSKTFYLESDEEYELLK